MATGEIIKRLRKQRGLTVDDLAERIGRNRATVYRYEQGSIENVPSTIIKELAIALDTTPAYLLETDTNSEIPNVRGKVVTVPIYSCLSCGTGTWINEQPEDEIGIPNYMMFSGRSFANPADGDSMEPFIHNGDLLVFKEQPEVESGKVGAFSLNNQYYCKRFKRLSDGSCWLFSDNSKYDPIPIKPEDDFRVLGLYKLKLSKEQ